MRDDPVLHEPETPEMKVGRRIYETQIKPLHGDAIDGQLIVIDPSSGAYTMDANHNAAVRAYDKRFPGVECVFVLEGRVIPGDLGGLGYVLWEGLTQEERDSLPIYEAEKRGYSQEYYPREASISEGR